MTLLQSQPSTARKLEELIDIQSPSTPADYFLPSTGIRAGVKFILINSGTATLTVKSSNGTFVTTTRAGEITSLISLVQNPTSATNWKSSANQPDPTTMSDSVATRLGYKEYLHNTVYNGGNQPTITLHSGGGTLSSVQQGIFVPYQVQSDEWRLKFNIAVTLSSTTRTEAVLAINGVTFKNIGGSHNGQYITGWEDGSATTSRAFVVSSTGRVGQFHDSTTTQLYGFSGDVQLGAKPTWAY